MAWDTKSGLGTTNNAVAHPELSEGFEIAGWNQPADQTGGD